MAVALFHLPIYSGTWCVTQAFTFASKKETLAQVAVSLLSGGLGTQEHDICDKNRQELVVTLARALNIPTNALGSAIETRKVRCAGLQESKKMDYEIAVFTMRHDVAVTFFGAELTGRQTRKVRFRRINGKRATDREEHETVFEAEIGGYVDASSLKTFQSVGGRGFYPIADGPLDGYMLTGTLDQNARAYQYGDSEWRSCGSHFLKKHILSELTSGLEASEAQRVVIEEYSTSAMTPFNSLVDHQSSRGYKVHYVLKGVQLEESDAADGFGLVKAKPVKLVADLPDGTTDASGLVPNLVATKFRLYVAAVRAKTMPVDTTGKFGGNNTAVWCASASASHTYAACLCRFVSIPMRHDCCVW